MAVCGCTPQSHACEQGKQLFIEVWCGSQVIESPLFPSRPHEEREETWRHYHEAVQAYLHHCGYAGVDNSSGV